MLISHQNLIIFYLAFLVFSVLLSALLNQILINFSKTMGIKNHDVTIIRWSTKSKPALGGISFFLVFLISVITLLFLSNYEGEIFWNNLPFLGMISAAGIAFLMGLSDDAYNTKPMLKFLIQILCGLILIITGTYIQLFQSQTINYIITMIWVVGLMNSINMLDNMDGITTLVSISIVSSALIIIYANNDINNYDTILLVGVLGALIGFLFHNWYPSKMFMGDTGSQFLGIFLAFIGIKYFWNFKGTATLQTDFYLKICLVALVFALPLIDTTVVTINRLLRGQPPYIGGKDHTTHALSYLGLKDYQVALVYGAISAICFLMMAYSIMFVEKWTVQHTLVISIFFVSLFGSFFYITKRRKVYVQIQKSIILSQNRAARNKVAG